MPISCSLSAASTTFLVSSSQPKRVFTVTGKEVAFTAKQSFQYTNDGQTVAVTYPRGGVAYKPGKYSVELYAEGFQIGTGAFEVK